MKHIKNLLTNYGRQLLFVVRVSGESMWPALVPGKTYLATNILRPRGGDMIIFRNRNNCDRVFVKRVKGETPEGDEVESLVSWGSSGEQFGVIPHGEVLGRLLLWK